MTQFVGKWTCYDSTELRGMVHSVSGGTIDVVPDAPYGSLLPGSPASGLVHLELYSTPCATNPEFIGTGEGPTPKVLDGGQQRDVRVGDHIRVVGAWCMENQHLDFEFLRGLFKAGFVFTEFHPYFPSTAQLLPNPQPGDPVDLTLTTRAPAYNQAYTLTWWWNRFGKVTATGDVAVVDESIRNPVTTDWSLDPPLLPDGGSPLTHSLVLRTIEEGRESLTQRVIVPASGNAIRFTVTLAGSDVAHASRFKATCRLRWVPRSAVR